MTASSTPLDPDGAEYDESVVVRAETVAQLASPVPPGGEFVRWKLRCHVHDLQRAQRHGVHEVRWSDAGAGGRGTCVCGLRVPRPRRTERWDDVLLRTSGHRELPALGGPEWVVVVAVSAHLTDGRCLLQCQRCGWSAAAVSWQDADALRREHRDCGCPSGGVL